MHFYFSTPDEVFLQAHLYGQTVRKVCSSEEVKKVRALSRRCLRLSILLPLLARPYMFPVSYPLFIFNTPILLFFAVSSLAIYNIIYLPISPLAIHTYPPFTPLTV